MALSDKDLYKIKDVVDFAVEKSELSLKNELTKQIQASEKRMVERINREISDIAETQREFLLTLGNHEKRIKKLEAKKVS